MNPTKPEHITLYYREGSSDKVYQAAIEAKGELFVVNFAFGRRGSTLSTGTKTSSPVDLVTAKKIYDKLVRDKMAKGYTPGEDGTPYQETIAEDRRTGILPQLLNPIEEGDVQRLIQDTAHCAQEKFDGRRMLVRKKDVEIHGINRKGLLAGLPETLFQSIRAIPGDFVLDGECVGDLLYAFDLLERGVTNLRAQPYRERHLALMNMLGRAMQRNLLCASTAFEPKQKAALFESLKREKKEGIVFKRLDAPYTVGRPNSGGAQLKHKFYATVSAVVSKLNAQRSVELRLLNCKGWLPVGNVTIPPNYHIPNVGAVVEVRYLYAFPESNALYQPTFLGGRTDVGQHECVLSQLKYKPAVEEEA
jgi:bifunctional non-homologous end joining protein LigD